LYLVDVFVLFLSVMKTEYATSYDHTTTVTQYSTTQQTSAGVIDKLYIKSIPGILKVVEVVRCAF